MAKILGSELPIGRAGYLISTLRDGITRGTPEDDPLVPGALLKFGSSTGHYEAFDGSETTVGATFAGIVIDRFEHINYNNTTGIAFGEFGDILVRGDILVPVSSAVVDLSTIVEGGQVYLGSDGKVAATGTVAKEIVRLKFLGITKTVDGVKLTAVRVSL